MNHQTPHYQPTNPFQALGEVYRYGVNTKEVDSEGMGGGSSTYDYGFRIYNAQLGKFLSVDPLTASYPWYTPYQFAGNKPIIAVDLDGLEELSMTQDFKLIHSEAIKILEGSEYCKNVIAKISNPALAKTHKVYLTGESRHRATGSTWGTVGADALMIRNFVIKGGENMINLSAAEAEQYAELTERFADFMIPWQDVANDVDNGKQVIIIAIDIDTSLRKDKEGALTAAFTVLHEINAHARKIIESGIENRTPESGLKDHMDYYGITQEELDSDLEFAGWFKLGASPGIGHKFVDEDSQAMKDWNAVKKEAEEQGYTPSTNNQEK